MENILTIQGLNKSFNKLSVLENIELEMHGGKVYGLIGANGSGKTVLMKMICGLMTPSSGVIKYNDKIVNKGNAYLINIGICIEKPELLENMTALDNLLFFAQFRNIVSEKEINKWLIHFELYNVRNKKLKEFSLGMKQKMAIILAIMEDPCIILLDEVTNSLDVNSRKILFNLIDKFKKEGKIILYVNHNFDEVKKVSDKIYMINDRKIEICENIELV